MPRLLVVSHSRSGSTEALVTSLVDGATHPELGDVEVVRMDALDATAAAVEAADACVLATPENFGYMSGALKMFLEAVYHPLLERGVRRPYALVVKAGTDGSGAVRSVERIVSGLDWPIARPPLVVVGAVDDEALAAAAELGLELAASLEAGLL